MITNHNWKKITKPAPSTLTNQNTTYHQHSEFFVVLNTFRNASLLLKTNKKRIDVTEHFRALRTEVTKQQEKHSYITQANMYNNLFPSCLKRFYQSQVWCTTIRMKMILKNLIYSFKMKCGNTEWHWRVEWVRECGKNMLIMVRGPFLESPGNFSGP